MNKIIGQPTFSAEELERMRENERSSAIQLDELDPVNSSRIAGFILDKTRIDLNLDSFSVIDR
jgi:hypothetical protein